MPQTLGQIMASLDQAYNPQRQAVQSQISALPGQQSAEQAGLDTAKTNAFQDINTGANAKGVYYSGMPIAEQAKYVGEKYLPAAANLKNTYANRGFQLQGALAKLQGDESTQAQNIQSGQQRAEADAAYKQQQLQLAQQRVNISAERASRGREPRQPSFAEQQAAVKNQFNQDLSGPKGAFAGFMVRPKGYTENVIIPQLQAAYPELDPKYIAQQVYASRKSQGYG